MGSLRLDGSITCLSLDGPADAQTFRAFLQEALCPTLRPGDVVILDNLSAHKGRLAVRLIRQTGADVRFLPAYSPDLNPIEKTWSKVKASLRSAEARTPEALGQAITAALASVTPRDALNWFASCGYSFI